eukprot:TRINITY_DN15829_c0_g1_i4.p1 TRINITY_DN15829_c0_g1~~TRINITY_DN15829_c0_g1_i4.p1  ORF type:complete len:101 (+),score=5.59 TRINITY_DN15829_c0_g1_i4:281-583(+)
MSKAADRLLDAIRTGDLSATVSRHDGRYDITIVAAGNEFARFATTELARLHSEVASDGYTVNVAPALGYPRGLAIQCSGQRDAQTISNALNLSLGIAMVS